MRLRTALIASIITMASTAGLALTASAPAATAAVPGVSVTVPGGQFNSSSLVRVPQTGTIGTAPVGPLTLEVPANGRASAQLSVATSNALNGLAATVSTPTSAAGDTLTGAVQVRWPEYITNEAQGGTVADPLRDLASVSVPAGTNQPIWFTVQVPGGTAPGLYRSTVTLTSAAGQVGSYSLQISVPQVALRPVAQRPFTLDLWSHPDAVADHLNVAPWSEAHFQALKPYWADLAAAGQDVVNVAVVEDPWLIDVGGGQLHAQTASPYRSTVQWRWDGTSFSFDFSVFDRIVTDSRAAGITGEIHAFAMLQFQSHDRLTYLNANNQLVNEPVTVGDARYRAGWGAFIQAFTAHLQQKGWLAQTRLAFDEQPLARMNAAFDVIKSVDASWMDRIALAANSLAEADISQYISFNYSFLASIPQTLIDQRRAAGKPTLFYTFYDPVAPNTVVATPPFNNRALAWVVPQRDLDGYLRWTYNSWPADYHVDPTYRYGQGDEYIIYPGATGPVSSIRWELLRDGLDDAEIIDLAKTTLGATSAVVTDALKGVNPAGEATAQSRETLVARRGNLLAALSGVSETSLAQWPIVSSTNGWGPIELNSSNGEDAAGDGGTITLNGRSYEQGIGAHAASTITFSLSGRCTRLAFDYGVDDEMTSGGSLAFVVKGDGVERWRSAAMTATSTTGAVDLDVTGVQTLELVLDPLGSNGQDHGDWAGVRVRCS